MYVCMQILILTCYTKMYTTSTLILPSKPKDNNKPLLFTTFLPLLWNIYKLNTGNSLCPKNTAASFHH